MSELEREYLAHTSYGQEYQGREKSCSDNHLDGKSHKLGFGLSFVEKPGR